jgi:hypothetical protein
MNTTHGLCRACAAALLSGGVVAAGLALTATVVAEVDHCDRLFIP